jgi:hypothetical protein
MKTSIDFNHLKNLLMEFAKSKGMTEGEVRDTWSIDYDVDIQRDYYLKKLASLAEAMSLFTEAMELGDDLTAKCALVDAPKSEPAAK